MSENAEINVGSKRPLEQEPGSFEDAKRLKPASPSSPAAEEPQTGQSEKKTNGDHSGAKNKGKGKEKGKGKVREKEKEKGKGRRRGTRPEGVEDAHDGPKAPRLPKRMCALLIGFCGTGCQGMQIQRDVRTIEGVLFDALVKAGAVSQDNADDPVKVHLGRAARTDAGVHAAGNLVSMKLITDIPDVPDMVARVNELLPPEIRFWSYVRTQNSFNARTSCDSRKYTYTFPSYVLLPPKPGSGLYRTLRQQSGITTNNAAHPFWSEARPDSTPQDDLRRKRQWRVGQDQIEALRAIVKKFEGSHNFHNFTVGRDFSDRSTSRYMKEIQVEDPVVYGQTEWISVLWHGQSFMLHQRKMMFALILSARTGTPPQIIDELYGPRVVFVPKMPSLGLLLEYPIFDGYNRKIAAANEKYQPDDPEYRPPIDFEAHREAINKFKDEHIYKNIREIEDQDGVFDAWIRSVDAYAGKDLLYLNSKAIIPAASVIKKGVKRENPFREKKRFDATGKVNKAEAEEEEEEEEESGLNKAQLADTEG